MSVLSILFPDGSDAAQQSGAPAFFGDLNLDQIIAAIAVGKEEYNLPPLFGVSLHDGDAVTFRHEVMRDLEDERLLDDLKAFARSMRAVRDHLAQLEKRYYQHQKVRWLLDAVTIYIAAVRRLLEDLSAAACKSRGLRAFRDYVSRYAASAPVTSLAEQTARLESELSAIRYNVLMNGPRVEVRPHQSEADYSAAVEATFERFKQGEVRAYTFSFSTSPEMNPVEGQILDLVAQLHHATFSKLEAFCAVNRDFFDPTIVRFDREIQFYVAYLDYIARFMKAGLKFCYPRMLQTRKEIYAAEVFDLALAGKLVGDGRIPVTNDFHLEGPQRIIVVSGPNQGGKTTFARTFGQLHYLASLGCPVPAREAQLYLSDRILTHFEREEDAKSLRGKLQDDLIRIHQILAAATPRSIIIINEIFASTTLRDAIFLSKKIALALIKLDLLCVWVTFIDEVSSLGEQTVSMVSTVVPQNPAERTFKILRRPADGLAYAMSIAEKYRLTYDTLKGRVGP